MQLTDTHCHLFNDTFDNIEEILIDSKNLFVDRVINSAYNLESSKEAIELAKKYDNMYITVGVHPEDAHKVSNDDIEEIFKLSSSDKVVALGEIGLDYYYTKEHVERQKEVFRQFLKFAESVDKPVVIHSRDATGDIIEILKEYKVRGVIHSFNGSLEVAKIYTKMGFLLGISGIVTFKNCNLKDVIREIDPKNIIIETDAPYLAPEPYRGRKNIPGYAFSTLKYVSELYGISERELMNITNENINKMFNI